jgi:Glyoxalase superfamily protein
LFSSALETVARQFGHDDWNVMAAKINELSTTSGAGDTGPFSAATTTIPVFRVFHVELAQAFYVDFLGFTLDWGGPSGEPGTPSTVRSPTTGPSYI